MDGRGYRDNCFFLMKGVTKCPEGPGFSLDLTEEVKSFLADKGYDEQVGAGVLHRAIRVYLEDPFAAAFLNLNAGYELIADVGEN